jgi:hypothetical protein
MSTHDKPAGALSDTARTVINLLLFVHLFALGVAIISNTSPLPDPGQPAMADLKRQFRQVPGLVAYLQLLNMDFGYIGGDRYQSADYHLTHNTVWDLAYRIEVTLKLPEGVEQEVIIPNASLQPGLRRLHYQMLATRMARLEGYDGPDAQIPLAVAKHYVRRFGATGGRLRLVGEMQRTMEELNGLDRRAGEDLPPLESRVAFDFYILVQGDNVSLLRAESTRDAAAPGTAAETPRQEESPPVTSPNVLIPPLGGNP